MDAQNPKNSGRMVAQIGLSGQVESLNRSRVAI